MIFFVLTISIYMAVLILYRPEPINLREKIPSIMENICSISMTMLIGVSIAIVHLFATNFTFIEPNAGSLKALGLNNLILPFFQPLQLITHSFTHANTSHLISNMLFLGILSSYERRVGWLRFLLVLLAGLIGGSMTIFVPRPPINSMGISAGLAALAAGYFLDYGDQSSKEKVRSVLIFVLIAVIFSIAGEFQYGSPDDLSRIDHWAHMGGAFGGIILSFLWKHQTEHDEFYQPPSPVFSYVVLVCIAAICSTVALIHAERTSSLTTAEYLQVEQGNRIFIKPGSQKDVQPYIDSLQSQGIFKENRNFDLRLMVHGDTVELSGDVQTEDWALPSIVGYYCSIKSRLERQFPHTPIELLLVDKELFSRRDTLIQYQSDSLPLNWLNKNRVSDPIVDSREIALFWNHFFQSTVTRNLVSVDWIGIPTPFIIASNGIAMKRFSEIDDGWKDLFASEEEAYSVYAMLGNAMSQIEWKSDESMFVSYSSAFKDMHSYLSNQ